MEKLYKIMVCVCMIVLMLGCQGNVVNSSSVAETPSEERVESHKRSSDQANVVFLATIRNISSVSSVFQNAIDHFNAENGEYVIEPVYYKDEASLQRAVISGDSIDIIDLYGLSTDAYVSKGILTDLYQYIDSDSDISRDDFVPAFLHMAEQQEHLLFLSSSFSARGLLVPRSVVGDMTTWTEQEFLAIAENLPSEYYIMGETSALDFFSIYLTYTMDDIVDLVRGSINLDNENFCKTLTCCKEAYRNSAQGTMPLLQYFNVIFGASQYVTYIREQSDEYALVGFPGADGNGALRYFATEQLAISGLSENSAGAWAFLKYLVMSEPGNVGFPVLQKHFDAVIASEMEDMVDENGNIVKPGMTDEEAMLLTQWLDNASGPGGAENASEVIEIILEEASAYITGDKNLDTVLNLIENRVAIYLAEQS